MKKVLLSASMLSIMSLNAQTKPSLNTQSTPTDPPIKTQNAVGINTEKPRATLDVNGDVRIQTIPKDEAADELVVVGKGNVISSRSLSGITGGSVTVGGTVISGAYGVGKEYECNSKNNGKTIWLTEGSITCSKYKDKNGNRILGWHYNGLGSYPINYGGGFTPINREGGMEYLVSMPLGPNITSGYSYGGVPVRLDDVNQVLYNHEVTAPLRVVDDSQYRP